MRTLLPAAIVLILALVVRLLSVGTVYGGSRTRLVGDSDPHYHVLRAEAWLAGAPGAPWRDPKLAWPEGADVPWPPLFDALVAGAAWLFAGGNQPPLRDEIAAVSAPLPVVLSLVFVVLAAMLGRRLGGRGWIAAFLVAVLPAASEQGILGRTDQHVLEVVLFTAALLLFAEASSPPRGRSRWRKWALAAVLVLAFWSWMGSAVHLLPALVTAAAWHLLDDQAADEGLRALALAGLAGAILLAASVAWLGAPGALASGATIGVGGLHVALLAASGAFAAILAAFRRARRWLASPWLRSAEVAVAVAAPGVALLLIPSVRHGMQGGLVALFAANPWYDRIVEFRPLIGSGAPLGYELLAILNGYGLVHVAAAIGLACLVPIWRERPDERARIVLLLVTFSLLVPASIARRRFGIYAVVPLALAAEIGIARMAERLTRALDGAVPRLAGSRASLAALAIATAAPVIPDHLAPEWTLPWPQEDCLRVAGALPVIPGAEAVLSPWSFGHLVRYFSDRPVIASPFGTEGGARVLEDTAAFWFATDQRSAEDALERRRAGLILIAQPVTEAVGLQPFAPPGTPIAVERLGGGSHGGAVRGTETFSRMIPNRLFFDDGLEYAASPALDAFRLLWETPTTSPDNPAREERWMLFERVPGARVRVLGAKRTITASVLLETSTRRRFTWHTEAAPGAYGPGVAELRLPYASGKNAGTIASEWTISDGKSSVSLVIHEADVREGRAFEIQLRSSGEAPLPAPISGQPLLRP